MVAGFGSWCSRTRVGAGWRVLGDVPEGSENQGDTIKLRLQAMANFGTEKHHNCRDM